jgi:nucleoside-triphosphatase
MSTQSSAPESVTLIKNLLLTGPPGCGKTTVLQKVAEQLGDLRLAGFLTLELREHAQRVGFEAVGLGGHRAILAHVRSRVSVGRYGVEPDRLIPLIELELDRPPGTVNAYLIDEIGKMECHCSQFISAIRRLLGGPVPVVATIALRCGGFIAEAKGRPQRQTVRATCQDHYLPVKLSISSSAKIAQKQEDIRKSMPYIHIKNILCLSLYFLSIRQPSR